MEQIDEHPVKNKELNTKISNEKNNESKKQKQKKVMYYSFEIIEDNKILDLLTNNLQGAYYSEIINKKIFINNNNLENNDKKEDEDLDINNTIKQSEIQIPLFEEIEKYLKDKDNGKILIDSEKRIYKINEKFHITMLFLKRTEDEIEKVNKIEEKIDQECTISINKIAFSEDFITLGVEFSEEIIPYYGNDVKHITVGLRKNIYEKKLLPKDSPNAFINGTVIELENKVEIIGKITKVMN
jgi:hypothetical protein